jgi:hypothetical protein
VRPATELSSLSPFTKRNAKIMKKTALLLLLALAAWLLWKYSGRRQAEHPPIATHLEVVEHLGAGERNILAIQPYMEEWDYASADRFREKLRQYLLEGQKAGCLRDGTTVLFPEYLGTWLVTLEEKNAVYRAPSIERAMLVMVLSRPVAFAQAFWHSRQEEDRVAAAIFRMKAAQMAAVYAEVFSQLAAEFEVAIVAGSIVLPGAAVEAGRLTIDRQGPLQNVTGVWMPDGTLAPALARKAYPISSELPFTQAAPEGELPVFELPGGRAAVLICADSWYPERYQAAQRQQAELVLVPSFCAGTGAMAAPWGGYDGAPTPADVDRADLGQLTEAQAWEKYALPGRLSASGAQVGANVFLRGQLWGLGSDGQPLLLAAGQLLQHSAAQRAGMWCLGY